MDFGYTPAQEQLRRDVLGFIRTHLTPDVVAEMDEAEEAVESSNRERHPGKRGPLVSAFFDKICERGWLGYSYPKEYGGQDGDRVTVADPNDLRRIIVSGIGDRRNQN